MITSGADFSGETVGDFQAVSSIDGFPDKPYLAEAWYEQTFADETISVLAGLFDTNSEFDTVEASDLFFNASRANGTEYAGAGRNGTGAYPITPLAVRLKWSPSDTLELRVAITEGTPRDPDNLDKTTIDFDDGEGVLGLAQINYFTNSGVRLSATYWQFSADFDVIDSANGMQDDGNRGVFGVIEGPISASEERGLYGFARIGIASRTFNEIESYAGGGLYYKAPFGRSADIIGLGVARSKINDRLRQAGQFDAAETNFEAAYHAQINDIFSIGAKAQYIKNPGTNPALDDALVLGLRFSVGKTLEWN